MNNRRKLVLALGASALAAPLSSFAQQSAPKIPRIGFLGTVSASVYAEVVEVFRSGLRDFGYVEGQNVVIEWRWAEGNYARLPELAAELVRLKVDVIVTHGSPGVRAARQATSSVPIVMAYAGDAVAMGFVASLARPGGNITGSTFFNPELGAKRLELLKEALPGIKHSAVFANSDNPVNATVLEAMKNAAKLLKIELRPYMVRNVNEVNGAFSAMTKQRADAIAAMEDPLISRNFKQITDFAAKHRMPSIGYSDFAEIGGLLVYGANLHDLVRRAGFFVDRILKGTKPAQLPVEQPTRFELKVNLKTAKQIGIKIPNSILVRADKVIE